MVEILINFLNLCFFVFHRREIIPQNCRLNITHFYIKRVKYIFLDSYMILDLLSNQKFHIYLICCKTISTIIMINLSTRLALNIMESGIETV